MAGMFWAPACCSFTSALTGGARFLGLLDSDLSIAVIAVTQRVHVQLADILPATAPALRNLRELHLQALGLDCFPGALAQALQQLSFLDLSNNRFARLPKSVTHIPTLVRLHLACNPPLQLKGRDIDILAALPELRNLEISKLGVGAKAQEGLTKSSICALIAIKRRLPHLRLPFS